MRFTHHSAILTAAAVVLVFLPSGRFEALSGQSSSPGDRWWAHVAYLASDELEGRDTGSEGHKKAAAYVADRFKSAGLEAAGTAGYLQPIEFVSRKIDESGSSLALIRDGVAEPVKLGAEATFSMRLDPAPKVEAPLVFAGYGLSMPEANHDDLAGLDLHGKVAVIISGGPASLPGPLSAHAQSNAVRSAALRKAGALGLVTIPNPRTTEVPWERSSLARLQPAMSLADSSLDDSAGMKVGVTFNPAYAERLFRGTPHTLESLLKTADEGKPLPRFALPLTMRATIDVDTTRVASDNVVAKLPGSDPALRDEYVVLTAHLDHVGIGGAVNGDRLYNGAMDNASGIATLIETAASLASGAVKPKRSVLFVAVTAEEKGLLGSRYFAVHPTVPASAIVANVNMDMFLPLFPFKTLTVLGLEESDLGAIVRRVAEKQGVTVEADPEPQRNRFIRSDQYSFIRQGVPALAMKVGYEKDSPEAAISAKWTKERYHAPSDDLEQPVDKEAAAGFNRLLAELTLAIANEPQRPRWKAESFFKRFATGR